MKSALGPLVSVWFVLVALVGAAEAITIIQAQIDAGVVEVQGRNAANSAPITWEGQVVTTSNQAGTFRFTTTILPSDCVGALSDGTQTLDVVVKNCGPVAPARAQVLKTGQTQCFDITGRTMIPCAGTGQDGEFQKGAARSYTDNGDGTITDNATGLMWEKLTDDGSIHDQDNVYANDQKYQKIADLNAASFAGYSDWRLPNINELQSLVDYGRVQPAIDPVFNNGVDSFTLPVASYYVSTEYQDFPIEEWWLCSFDGSLTTVGCGDAGYVRAVRGGP